MEFLIIVAILSLVSYFWSNSENQAIEVKKNDYTFSLSKSKQENDNTILSIKVRGSAPTENKFKNLMVQFSIHDVTTNNKEPVYSTHQLKQEDTTETFYYAKKMKKSYSKSTSIANINTKHLLTSKGESDRKIQISIRVLDGN